MESSHEDKLEFEYRYSDPRMILSYDYEKEYNIELSRTEICYHSPYQVLLSEECSRKSLAHELATVSIYEMKHKKDMPDHERYYLKIFLKASDTNQQFTQTPATALTLLAAVGGIVSFLYRLGMAVSNFVLSSQQ